MNLIIIIFIAYNLQNPNNPINLIIDISVSYLSLPLPPALPPFLLTSFIALKILASPASLTQLHIFLRIFVVSIFFPMNFADKLYEQRCIPRQYLRWTKRWRFGRYTALRFS